MSIALARWRNGRLALLAAACLAVGAWLALTLEVRSDPAGVLGAEMARDLALGAADQQAVVVALVEPDRAKRAQISRHVADHLAADPRIASVNAGPELASDMPGLLWQHRLALAPPTAADLTPGAMAERLRAAQRALARAEGAALGDRLLRDPTGSFARLMQAVRGHAPGLGVAEGVWQAQDGSAALLFVQLAEAAGDLAGLEHLPSEIATMAGGARTVVVGPRIVAAEIGARMERASVLAGALGGGLLLLWLVVTLRSVGAIAWALLVVALGAGVGIALTQALLGPIHVVALGFGAALCGLGLDYPLHLLGHRGAPRARRLVLIGALTTATAFLAMLGAGPDALAQTGLFVANGLLTIALVSRWVFGVAGADAPRSVATPPLHRLAWPLPGRRWVVSALALAGLALLLGGPERPAERLVAIPPETEADIALLRNLLPLPSGTLALVLEADSPATLRTRSNRLDALLDQLAADGVIGGARIPLPPPGDVAVQRATLAGLPTAEALKDTFQEALSEAGMNPAFATQIGAAYAEARAAGPVALADLPPIFAPPQPGDALTIRLVTPIDADRLAEAVAGAAVPGLRLIDSAERLSDALADLADRVILSLAVGAGAAALVLVVALRDLAHAGSVLLTTAGALGAVLITIHLTLGPPDIFQTIALTLVAGIGIDYALFLRSDAPNESLAGAGRSVGLCAGSTLLAFGAMAASPTRLLSEIGLTVSLGVVAVLALTLAHAPLRAAPQPLAPSARSKETE